MPIEFNNADHFGKIFPPVNDQIMILQEFSGNEAVNEISLFRLRGATKRKIDLNKFIGRSIRVEIKTGENSFRQFHQVIFSARDLGRIDPDAEEESYAYEFELRPWIWVGSRSETSRIFHNLKLDEIIRKVLDKLNSFDGCKLEFNIRKMPPILEYTVQYLETDLNFVMRLMEEYGMNYHCKMEKSGHTIVISDNVDAFTVIDGKSRAHFGATALNQYSEFFSTWLPQRNLTTGKARALDYNFKTTGAQPSSSATDTKSYEASDLESFHYSGRIQEPSVANDIVKRRLDALRMGDSQVRTSGSLPSLGAGMKVQVFGAEPASENGDYACLSANHHYVHGACMSNSASDNSYDGAFILTRQDVPIAPKRVTVATTVQGPMTAIVVLGGHDDVDEYGRIKVKFHWQSDEENSMYCRVSQMWAGNNWGSVFLPQTGMEVIVEFLNGHIDYPIIMGCVYNAQNMPPWPLPGKNKISGIKTVTENQLSFDDTAGAELIEMIGTKDLKVTIKNNVDEDVKVNETRVVGGEFKETVTGSITIESKQTITLKVGQSKIEISQSGIKLSAMMIEASAEVSMKTSGGATAEHKSTGIMTISGALVKIN